MISAPVAAMELDSLCAKSETWSNIDVEDEESNEKSEMGRMRFRVAPV